jgi:hypothetical protein
LLGGFGWGGRQHAGHGEIKGTAVVEPGVDEHELGVRVAGAAGIIGCDGQRRQVIGAGRLRAGISDGGLDPAHVVLQAAG